jgi:hypothetical protein
LRHLRGRPISSDYYNEKAENDKVLTTELLETQLNLPCNVGILRDVE